MKQKKIIMVDDNDEMSILHAERKKARLENTGYNLVSTEQLNFNKFILTYEKVM